MSLLLFVSMTAVALAALYVSARKAVTVCVLDIRDGEVRVVHGGLSPRVLADIEDVAQRPPLSRATIRVTRDRGRAAVHLRGDVPEAQAQRLRNVVGSVPLAALASTPRARR